MIRQNKFIKLFVHILFTLTLISVLGSSVSAASTDDLDWNSFYVYGDSNIASTKIASQTINGEKVVVLPSTVSPDSVQYTIDIPETFVIVAKGDASSVQLTKNGSLDLNSLCDNNYTITFTASNDYESAEYTLKFLFSDNIGTMYLVSDDPVNEGREWVESSADKSNKATGSMVLQNAACETVYNGTLTQIKGRGNSTWSADKKPYQIKLDSKTDLLQTGNSANKSKTWVLLANYYDPTLIRNSIALNLGNALGLEFNIESTYIDLYYDGEYRGCYLLSEKVEIGSGRVNITDMEELNEDANPDVGDLADLPTATATTSNGATYVYCENMVSPDDITGGYLLEMDYPERAMEEICYFYTTRGKYITVKSPECASKEEMEYIASLYQEYEDAIYNGGTNPSTGKDYTEYVDLKSTVYCYLINEFSRNRDAFFSSAYLYKDAGEDILYMGPLWDYDLTFGNGGGEFNDETSPTGLATATTWFGSTLHSLGDFRAMVREIYETELYPLIQNVVLGDRTAISSDGSLHSLNYYSELVSKSAVPNDMMWNSANQSASDTEAVRNFISSRAEYLKETFSAWSADTYEPVVAYTDVTEDAWYYEEVNAATRYGLMRGVAYAKFSPDTNAARSHVAQTIYNMEKAEPVSFTARFSDVSPSDWFSSAVTWASESGIVKGYPDGTFMPDTDISREDLVVLLHRYSGTPEVTTDNLSKFADADSVSDYATAAMEWAVTEGLIQGYGGDYTIRPQGTTNRAELAAVLVRYYEKIYTH